MKRIEDYIREIRQGIYKPLPKELFDEISEEGFVDELEEVYGLSKLTKKNFMYIELSLSKEDRQGLIGLKDDVVKKV